MRVYVKGFGCSTNLADSEVLAGCLASDGHQLVKSVSQADVVVIDTCAVKGPTEDRMISLLKRVQSDKKLVVAGCLPLINWDRLCKEVRFDGVVGPAVGDMIVQVVNRVVSGEKVVAIEKARKAMPSLTLPRVSLNPVVSILPVSYGCLGSCAYCCVTFARGSLRSYTIEEIADRVRRDLTAGVHEFWITSQDTACYGKDRGLNLATLLNALCSIDGDFSVRVGMMTPNSAMDFLEGLVKAYDSNHMFKFVHLPVQSGDDEVLKRMRRRYSVYDFRKTADVFKARFPDITLSTDVICGFPSESVEAFENTLQLIETVKPDIVNVSKFFARPRTLAAEIREDLVPPVEIRRRSDEVARLAKKVSLENNRCWLGWTGEVIIDEAGKTAGSWVGRNFAYKPIVVRSARKLLGTRLHVKVCSTYPTYLEGEIVST